MEPSSWRKFFPEFPSPVLVPTSSTSTSPPYGTRILFHCSDLGLKESLKISLNTRLRLCDWGIVSLSLSLSHAPFWTRLCLWLVSFKILTLSLPFSPFFRSQFFNPISRKPRKCVSGRWVKSSRRLRLPSRVSCLLCFRTDQVQQANLGMPGWVSHYFRYLQSTYVQTYLQPACSSRNM